MIDTSFSPEAYTNEMLRFLDDWIPRDRTTRFAVLIDVRGHHTLGYNPSSAFQLLSHLSSMGKAFQAYFPERLSQVLIYPFGVIEMMAYKFISVFFSKATLEKVVCLHD